METPVISRRDQILEVAAELFAEHGFHGVSIVDLGAACGFSGPAIYKHFRSKQAILSEMLVSISEELLAEGTRRVREAADDEAALAALIDWHVTFALTHKQTLTVGEPVTIAVRPESLSLSSDPVPGTNSIEAQVDIGLFVGESVDYHVQMGDLLIRVKGSARSRFRRHDKVYVGIPPEDCTVIAEDGATSAPLAVNVVGLLIEQKLTHKQGF